MNITAKISGRIIVLMKNHMEMTGCGEQESLEWAYDQVLGAGAYAALASDLYDAMTAA